MRVLGRQAEALGRLALEVEFDHDSGFLARDPRVVTRLQRDHCWGFMLEAAAIGVAPLDPTASEEPDVGVHAEVRANFRLHVLRPAKAGGVNDALHPTAARRHDVDRGAAYFAVLGSVDRCGQRIHDGSLIEELRKLQLHGCAAKSE
jgi:hypothetical protein